MGMIEPMLSEEPQQAVSKEAASAPDVPRQTPQVCLLGASFDTGNLGVSALAESSVRCILARWSDAQVILLASSRDEGWHRLKLADRTVAIRKVPIRFCRNVFLSHHYGVLFFLVLLLRVFPFDGLKRYLARRNATLKVLLDSRLFVDITGGDSFSDIYGLGRFVQSFLIRMLPLMLGKDLILFPQTYGPFKRALSRSMARYVLRRSRRIYSRDQAGLDFVKELLKHIDSQDRIAFAPDVALLLEPRRPAVLDVEGLDAAQDGALTTVGLNVSGLIYYGGYRGGNEFGLRVAYRELVDAIVERLMQKEGVRIVLVPHVIPSDVYEGNVENDLAACLDVHGRLSVRYPGRLFVARGTYDQGEVKYIIGMCDFFVGTRMHSCIAALSQHIPAVGVAYSKKFKGVFQTVGVENLVADMRSSQADEILATIEAAFASRESIARRLRETVPEARRKVSRLLEGLDA